MYLLNIFICLFFIFSEKGNFSNLFEMVNRISYAEQ